MRALVTGGAGFIGSAIARALLERGDEVSVLDSLVTGRRDNVPEGVTLAEQDLRNLDAVGGACRGIDVVFHQGAIRSVPRSVEDPLLSIECNVIGTANVLVAAEKAGVSRVVYASSSSAYGDTGGAMNEESLPTNPASPYAASKLAGEHLCRIWNDLKGLSTVSLRYFNVFGPGQPADSRYAAVFPAFITALGAGRPPEIYGDGEQTRDFTYIEDVVAANLAAAAAGDEASGAVLNVGGGQPRTVNEVLRSVSDASGAWVDPVYLPPRPGDVRHTRADLARARRLLGWEPRAEWEAAVAATVRWFSAGRTPATVAGGAGRE